MDGIDKLPSHEHLSAQDKSQHESSYLAVWEERRNRVINILKSNQCHHILDLGCGEGRLFQAMKFMPEFRRLVGLDIDIQEISKSYDRVGPQTYHIFSDDPPEDPLEVAIYCGDLTKPFPTLRKENCDAITMVEVIEHLPAAVLERLPFVLFGFYRPRVIVISTPNREYNKCIKGFDLNTFRHFDHKFEWTRREFQDWCEKQMHKFDGYEVTFQTVGRLHPAAEESFFSVEEYGRCTQIATFKRKPGAQGPILDGTDIEEYDESSLEVIKNFKFPSKTEIENLKISHAHPEWDDDEAQEPDYYEYSEGNTDWEDEVDPEWWNVVWNKSVDDEKVGEGNGQGWDDSDLSLVGSWQYDGTWSSENEDDESKDDLPYHEDSSPVVSCDSEYNDHTSICRSDASSVNSITAKLKQNDMQPAGTAEEKLTDESNTFGDDEQISALNLPVNQQSLPLVGVIDLLCSKGCKSKIDPCTYSPRLELKSNALVEEDRSEMGRSEIMQGVCG